MMSPAFWIQAVVLALSQIRANLGRSLLTALGIIVGVASGEHGRRPEAQHLAGGRGVGRSG